MAIATPRAGRYPPTLVDGLSPERLARFFTAGAASYTVKQAMRAMCTFSAQSLIRDPPFCRIDLISCRNLLIYIDTELQGQVVPIFHYALRPRGFLVLHASESIAGHEALFEPRDRSLRILCGAMVPVLAWGFIRWLGLNGATGPMLVWATEQIRRLLGRRRWPLPTGALVSGLPRRSWC